MWHSNNHCQSLEVTRESLRDSLSEQMVVDTGIWRLGGPGREAVDIWPPDLA